ncbi:hypothetical protein JYQ62_23985 [Nostoc sp. UHCC 0702]|nr:hypothetical protein JYQ62_23985 [Nostoc sp. UHCC 0702]
MRKGLGIGDWGLGIGDWVKSCYANLKNDCDRWIHRTQMHQGNSQSEI